MAGITPTDTAELAAADEQLRRFEAEQAAEPELTPNATKTDDTTPADDRAPAGDKSIEADPSPKIDADTPLEADEVEKAKTEAEKEGKELELDDKGVAKRGADGKFVKRDKKPVEPAIVFTPEESTRFDKYLAQRAGSKYAKDFNRRLVTWTEINAQKDGIAAERAKFDGELKQARVKFDADVAEFNAKRNESTPTPEKYEAFAAKCADAAKVKRAEAITAANDGKVEESEKLNDEAKFLDRDANAAKSSAEHVRKNPPPDAKATNEKFAAEQKTWIGKAVTDFPEFGKKDSELQKAVSEVFRQAVAGNPRLAKLPDLVYYCARIAAAESAANRVPALTKELGELRTKVKDLEVLTNPVGGGSAATAPRGAKSWDSMSSEEQFESLRAEASQRR